MLGSGGSTVVDHSATDPVVKGSNPAGTLPQEKIVEKKLKNSVVMYTLAE
jgi:hypothetical protein